MFFPFLLNKTMLTFIFLINPITYMRYGIHLQAIYC